MKKTTFGILSLVTLVAPIAIVTSCGDNNNSNNNKPNSESNHTNRTLAPDINQWKKDFPQYASKIVGTKLIDSAFDSVIFLQNFYLPEGLTEIGIDALDSCVFYNSQMIFPSTLTTLNEASFYGCTFNNMGNGVKMPDGITNIPDSSFSTVIFSGPIFLPSHLVTIDINAFDSTSFSQFDDNGVEVPLVFPQSLTTIGEDAFDLGTLIKPDGYQIDLSGIGHKVDEVRQWFLANTGGLNNTVGDINRWKQDFPQYANKIVGTKISDNAFKNEVNFPANFYLPDGLTEIGVSAFNGALLYTPFFQFPSTLVNIDQFAFQNASFYGTKKPLVVPDGVTKFTTGSFAETDFGRFIVFPNHLTEIDTGAFENTFITTFDDNGTKLHINLPNSLTKLGTGVFDGTTLYNVNRSNTTVPTSNDIAFLRKWFAQA